MSNANPYVPFASKVLAIVEHTEREHTFVMSYEGEVKPGQFFEVSIPKYGEAPISVSGNGRALRLVRRGRHGAPARPVRQRLRCLPL